MTLVRWKRFTWDLKEAPPRGGAALPSFQIKGAAQEDERAVGDVILNALSLDFGWGDVFKGFRATLEAQLAVAFDRPTVPVIVMRHGQRIIGASLLAIEPDADNHLLSGPCVLAEYRNRGIGSVLLLESLTSLRGASLARAHGVCRDSSSAGKFVYRKFGSTSQAWDLEPPALVQ